MTCIVPGGVEPESVLNILTKLKQDVMIEKAVWLELPQPELMLRTWGFDRMYIDEKMLKDCSVDEVLLLLPDAFEHLVQHYAAKEKSNPLEKVQYWQDKVSRAFRENQLDGTKILSDGVKLTCNSIMNSVQRGNVRLRNPLNVIIRFLKTCNVHEIMEKATNATS